MQLRQGIRMNLTIIRIRRSSSTHSNEDNAIQMQSSQASYSNEFFKTFKCEAAIQEVKVIRIAQNHSDENKDIRMLPKSFECIEENKEQNHKFIRIWVLLHLNDKGNQRANKQ